MKHIFIILSIFLAQTILAQDLSDLRKQALEGKTDCNGSVYSSDTHAYYANLNTLKVFDLKTGKESAQISTSSPITAIKSDTEKLFILTESNLEIWDLAGQKQLSIHTTHPTFAAPYNFYEQPRGLAITADKIYIAHGVNGVIVIDRNNEKLETVIPTKSTVRDIAIVGNTAVLVIDNNTQDGFHGFALINLQTQQVQKYIGVENVFPESIHISGDTLLVGYFSTIWKYKTQDVLTQSNPNVLSRVFNFPEGPGTIVGKAYYDTKNMYACYESVDHNGQNPKKHIVVFDRNTLGL